jgi:hypothetical protein
MNRLTTEQFKQHFTVDKETLILSPQVAMIASFLGHQFDFSFDPSDVKNKTYDTVLIDISENQKFPGSSAKHEYRWLKHAFDYLSNNKTLICKVPIKVCSQVHDLKDLTIDKVEMFEEDTILKLRKGKTNIKTSVVYDGQIIEIDVSKTPILHTNIPEYYSYFENVSDKDALEYISLSAGLKENNREQYNKRVKWNTDRVVCVSTGFENSNIKRGLNMYSFEEIADRKMAVDCFYVPEDINYDSFVKVLKSQKFLSFLSSVCYNNYQSFKKQFKKKVFNKKIIEFCNEE